VSNPARQTDPKTVNKESQKVTSPRNRLASQSRFLLGAIGLTLLLLSLTAGTAAAAPSLGLEVRRETASLNRGDEWLEYTIKVRNTAVAVAPGDTLRCASQRWSDASSFTYQWLRDGASLGAANGAQTPFYTVQEADKERALQCVVTATNAKASARFITNALIVPPAPPVASPTPFYGSFGNPGVPEVETVESTKLRCVAPADWIGSPTWAFQWLRNGVPISGATATTYTPENPGADEDTVLQCEAVGTNAGGSQATISAGRVIGTIESPNPPSTDFKASVSQDGPAILTPTPVEPGDSLKCAPQRWENKPAFSYQWLRDGVSLGAANGAQTTSYAVQVADQGHSLQCLVTGANASASASFVAAPLYVPPLPVAALPAPYATGWRSNFMPRIELSSAPVNPSERTCTPPENWDGSPTWAFQWLRNGAPIPGATEANYTPENPGADAGTVLQCEAIGSNPNGTAVAVSEGRTIGSVTDPPSSGEGLGPLIATPDYLHGPLTLEVEAPAGLESQIQQPDISGYKYWDCSTHPPTESSRSISTCTSTDQGIIGDELYIAPGGPYLGPGGGFTFELLKVRIAVGDDTPDDAVTTFRASGGGAPSTSMQDQISFGPGLPFGLKEGIFQTKVADQFGADYTQAGGHPTTAGEAFQFNWHYDSLHNIRPTDHVKNANTQTPPGFVGNALAVPVLCPSIEQVQKGTCPERSAVGGIDLYLASFTQIVSKDPYPQEKAYSGLSIYAIEPEYGVPAQFAFTIPIFGLTYTFTPELRAEDGYAISLNPAPIIKFPELIAAVPTLCSFGTNLGPENIANASIGTFLGCKAPTDPKANPVPLITNPTRCSGPAPTTKLSVASWEHPQDFFSDTFTSPPVTGCEAVQFEPKVVLDPTNHSADSPTGLNVEITMPTDGLETNSGISQANLDTATVTFPQGMSVNPSVAQGLNACTRAEVKMKSNDPAECPDSSKIGTIEIKTPLIREVLTGNVYVAKQNDNPFNAPLGLYMVFASKKDGVIIKVAGKVITDPVTGQLTSVFTENPEAPFSRLALHFNSGDRAPLVNPPKCGTYAIHAEMSPWSALNPANPTPAEIVASDSTYQVTSGPGGGPCPSGALDPKLKAGLQNTQAGSKSPFVLSLSREDGSQRFTALDVSTPKGLTAYLKGVPYCPESALASISAAEEAGRPEMANPTCPAASQVGTVSNGAGAGPYPFYANTGKAYLAGPYKGAPVSLAIVVPAVAGPFDLGNVVVRNALYVDPDTAQVTVKSDPIPTILHGILLDVKDIRVAIDRPGFTVAPTSCEPASVNARVTGESGAVATASDRFQVGGCDKLAFKPKLKLRLFGGTHRGSHPRLVATLTAPEGSANIAAASVALPHSEFLEQAHIKTICTRVQFAAKQCPAGSVYGYAEAVTPLLDSPLSGPVYLRSSSNPLPDLVVALRGPDSQPIEVNLVGRIDSVNGGIRNSFDLVPDAPVSSFMLKMQGGKKGLLVNSRNLCKSVNKATANFTAQNGKAASLRPVLQNSCKQARKGGKKSKRAHKRHR
jgi:hypothetical protein